MSLFQAIKHVTIEGFIVAAFCFVLHLIGRQLLITFKPEWAPKVFTNHWTRQMGVYLWVYGYCKHLVGNYCGLHTLYCSYGWACGHHGREMGASSDGIFYRVSPGEGVLFVVFAYFLMKYFRNLRNLNILIPVIGFLAHTSFEVFGIHKAFCDATCHAGRAF
jgi:hypothetical protein